MQKDIELYLHGPHRLNGKLVNVTVDFPLKKLADEVLDSIDPKTEPENYLFFIENQELALDKNKTLEELEIKNRSHIHLAKVDKITVSVIYNGATRQDIFRPQMTVKKVLQWALKEFNIPVQDRKDMVLKDENGETLSEHEHIGSIIEPGQSSLTLYLAREQGVQG